MRSFRLFPFVLIAAAAVSLLLACGGGGGGNGGETYYADTDGDGYGNAADSQVLDSAQAGWVLDSTDCNDTPITGALINPGVSEDCDGQDNDCNPLTADGADEATLDDPCDGADSDQCIEGNVICAGGILTCSDYTADNVEVCNNADDDCDGTVDNDWVDGTVTYTDLDGTGGYVKGDSCGTGDCVGGTVVCAANEATLECTTSIYAAVETCDGADNDCDGTIDNDGVCTVGTLDDTFGGDVNPVDSTPDGFTVFTASNNDYGFGVAPGMSGGIYVAGSYDGNQNDMALWRYTSSGVLDTTFGGDAFPADGTQDGWAVYDRGSYDTGWAAALDVSGRIYLAGHTHGGASNYDMTLLRYDDSGVLDTGFGTNGVVTHAGAAGGVNLNDHGVAVTLDPDGRVYVAGYSQDGGGVENMTIWRYTSSGVLDTSFGGDVNPADGIQDGFALYNGGGNHRGQAVAWDSTAGRIFVAGYGTPSSQDMVLLCYDSAGILDTTFDGDGILTFDGVSAGNDAAGLAVTLDSAGRIYVAGANQSDSIVWRFTSDGALDTTFGGDTTPVDGTQDGFIIHDNAAGGNGIDEARAIALDPSGLIYVAGNSQGVNEDMVLWRYTSSGVLDTTFGEDVNPSDGTPDGFIVQEGTAGGNGVDRGTAVAVGTVDSDKVYVAGYSHNGSNFDMVLWRFK